jgi:hypothetical protein
VRRAYLDPSAIIKLVCAEPESPALVDFLQPPIELCTSGLSEIEVTRALLRRGFAAADAQDTLASFFIIGLDATIRLRAATLAPVTLQSLDAIHVATALEAGGAGLRVVTYDDGLGRAARGVGLTVVSPGREP